MLGEIKFLLERKEHDLAEAQVTQCMKAVHQFGITGNWKMSWPYTHLPDPCEARSHAGGEEEAEVILASLKTREDLKKKIHTRDLAGEDEDELPAKPKK